jgi:iron complex transport system ATP-binding protein
MTALDLNGVAVTLSERRIVEDITLTLRGGEMIGLIGPNGAGKTTLMRAMAALIPAEGDILADGAPVRDMRPRQRGRTIAYLPQGGVVHWALSVREVVRLGRLPHIAPLRGPTPEDEAAIESAMARTDVTAFADRALTTLSGGERARVLLARALATGAPVLLVDEPVASLDPYHQLHVMELLADTAARGTLVIAVLHDLALAARYCRRLVLLHEGRIAADGAPEAVLTADRLAAVYRIAMSGADGGDAGIAGTALRRLTDPAFTSR